MSKEAKQARREDYPDKDQVSVSSAQKKDNSLPDP